MKYFYDTEFLDDGRTIDLISIGIVAEDGREYYAVNLAADWARINAHPWLPKNVVAQLPPTNSPAWKYRTKIRDEVHRFLWGGGTAPELWAWFAAYDHVALSQLWGRMLDLPVGIPMYTHDLRAYLDYFPAPEIPKQQAGLHDALQDARHVKTVYEHIEARRRAA